MRKNYNVKKAYDSIAKDSPAELRIYTEYSETTFFNQTTSGDDNIDFAENLQIDVDAFSELPNSVFANTRALHFLEILKKAITNSSLEGITLSKMRVSESSETSLSIDWIYNYFRVYFSFESDGNDSYGMIYNNSEKEVFSNYFEKLKVNEYEVVAYSIINYVVKMMGGQ